MCANLVKERHLKGLAERCREIWAWTLLVCAVCAVEFACHIWFLPLRCAHRVTLQQLSPSSQCCPGHMSALIYIYIILCFIYIYIIYIYISWKNERHKFGTAQHVLQLADVVHEPSNVP